MTLVLTLVVACTSTASATLTDDPRPAILAASARDRIDRFADGAVAFARIGIVHHLGCPTADGFVTYEACAQFTQIETATLEATFAPISVVWVDSWSELLTVSETPDGQVEVALVSLAVPEIDGDDAVVVSALMCAGRCGVGGATTLHRGDDGVWTVTGTTGPQWES